jgi:HlyD family secretion protein
MNGSEAVVPALEPVEPQSAPSEPALSPPRIRLNKRKWFRRIITFVVLMFAIGGAGISIYRLRGVEAAATLAMAPVRQGEFTVIVRCRGELKAQHSVQVTAPVNVPELRIIWLAPQGEAVKPGDPVVRFDPSSARQQLQEKKAALQQAQAALDQAVAQARITVEQDKLELAGAEYLVEKAKLEVSKAEIVSKLQGEESRVDLSIAETKLRVQKATVELNDTSSRSKIASLERAREKAKDEMELTQYRLDQMELRAPSAGVIYILPNQSQGWMNAKPFKVGDQAWPGGALVEIPALDSLEMEGKLDEIDRGRLKASHDVMVRLDSLPEITFPASLSSISPMTVMGWEWPPTRTFRGFAKLQTLDKRLRPGMNGRMDLVVDRIPNALSVPAKALFTRAGRPIVYVSEKGSYVPIDVEIVARNPDEVAVKGVKPGMQVALVEPERKGKS